MGFDGDERVPGLPDRFPGMQKVTLSPASPSPSLPPCTFLLSVFIPSQYSQLDALQGGFLSLSLLQR